MDKIQINRLEMARAVKNFLDGNATVWSSIPVMVSTKNTMDGLLDGIREQAEKQEDSRVRVGASKNEKKKNICVKIDILNDAVEAYAGINNKPDLADRADKSASDLLRLRNEDFITTSQNQIAMVEDVILDLVDYGITQDQIDDVKADLDDYLELEGQPRAYRIAERQATAELASLFSQLSETLERMDQVAKVFKRSQPEFYNGYLAARTIVDN